MSSIEFRVMPSKEKTKAMVRGLLEESTAMTKGASTSDPERFLLVLDDLPRREIRESLLEELKCPDELERLFAARLFLLFFHASEECHLAIGVLLRYLDCDSEELQSTAYGILQWLPFVPQEAFSIVEKHLSDDESVVRHLVPAVALRIESLKLIALQILLKKLNGECGDEVDRFESAIALIHFGLHSERAWQYLIGISEQIGRADFFLCLSDRLVGIGASSKIGFDFLLSGINDATVSQKVRDRLVYTIGTMAQHSFDAKQMLIELLSTDSQEVVLRAAENLKRLKEGFPPDAIQILIKRLESRKVRIRNMAATVLLWCCPPLVGRDAQFIVERMAVERDIVVLEKLAKIAVEAGEHSIRPLLELAKRDTTFRNWISLFALGNIGETARAAMLRAIVENPSSQASRLFSAHLSSLQICNRFEEFSNLLESDDQDLVTNLLVALSRAGHEAEKFTPSLLKIALSGDRWRSDLACKVIESIGPIALSHFIALEEQFPGNELLRFLRYRLEEQGLLGNGIDDLRWIKQPKWIKSFVLIVDAIEEYGPMGMLKIASILKQKNLKGQSDSNLRKAILGLENALSERRHRVTTLIDSGNNKAGNLTEDGRAFAKLARAFVNSMKV